MPQSMDNKKALFKMLLAGIWLFSLAIWPFTVQAECIDPFQKDSNNLSPSFEFAIKAYSNTPDIETLLKLHKEHHDPNQRRTGRQLGAKAGRQLTIIHDYEHRFDFYY